MQIFIEGENRYAKSTVAKPFKWSLLWWAFVCKGFSTQKRWKKRKEWADFSFFFWRMTIQNRTVSVRLCVMCKRHRKGSFMRFNLQWPLIRSGSTLKSTTGFYVTFEAPILFAHSLTFFAATNTAKPIRWAKKKIRFITKADNFSLLLLLPRHCFQHSEDKKKKRKWERKGTCPPLTHHTIAATIILLCKNCIRVDVGRWQWLLLCVFSSVLALLMAFVSPFSQNGNEWQWGHRKKAAQLNCGIFSPS